MYRAIEAFPRRLDCIKVALDFSTDVTRCFLLLRRISGRERFLEDATLVCCPAVSELKHSA